MTAAAFNDDDFTEPIIHKLRAIVRGVIQEQRKLFGHLPAISPDDLEQEGMLVACRRHKAYDAKKGGAYSVWVGDAVRNRFIDIFRVGTKSKTREQAVASVRKETDEALNATPMTRAAICAEAENYLLPFGADKVTVGKRLDARIKELAEQFAAEVDYHELIVIRGKIHENQTNRMSLCGSYFPIVVETVRYTASSFISFAPKPQPQE